MKAKVLYELGMNHESALVALNRSRSLTQDNSRFEFVEVGLGDKIGDFFARIWENHRIDRKSKVKQGGL